MRKISALIDSLPLSLNVSEELSEFRGVIRAGGGNLGSNEGYLFNFVVPSILYFENVGVQEHIALLFFHPFVESRMRVVTEVKHLKAGDTKIVSSGDLHSVVLELRADFCLNSNIKEGSILTLEEELP